MSTPLAASYLACHEVMERASRSFTLGARFLPPDARQATYALYAMFRTLDDLVDTHAQGSIGVAESRERLQSWRGWFEAGCVPARSEPIVPAVRETMHRYAVPPELFLDLISAFEDDIAGRRYEDLDAVIGYCYGVAATVGLAMCRVLQAPETAHPRAAELGVAMQLTNILRDVGEDLAMGRLYLPGSLLEGAGLAEADLRRGRVTPAYAGLMERLAGVADAYYASGRHGIGLLPAGARRGVALAAAFYQDILVALRRNGYDNLTRRARTGGARKLWLGLRSALAGGPPAFIALPPGLPDGAAIIARGRAPVLSTSAPGPGAGPLFPPSR